jgi:hypothetical protein
MNNRADPASTGTFTPDTFSACPAIEAARHNSPGNKSSTVACRARHHSLPANERTAPPQHSTAPGLRATRAPGSGHFSRIGLYSRSQCSRGPMRWLRSYMR